MRSPSRSIPPPPKNLVTMRTKSYSEDAVESRLVFALAGRRQQPGLHGIIVADLRQRAHRFGPQRAGTYRLADLALDLDARK